MPTVTIHQAATSTTVTSQKSAQSPSGPDNAFQALLNLADIPDPGGGPPTTNTEAGASIQGPNAQSNQPDLLPLLESVGSQTQSVGTSERGKSSSGTNGALSDPTLLIPSGAILEATGLPAQPDPGSSSNTPPAKGTKAGLTDPTVLALMGLGGCLIPADAGPIRPVTPATGTASVASGVGVPPAPVSMPAGPPPPSQPSAPVDEMLQVIVDAPPATREPHALPVIQNATVSAVATKSGPEAAVAFTAAVDGAPQGSSGNSGGDHAPNQQPPTPDPGGAAFVGSAPATGQTSPVNSNSSLTGPTLSESQRLDVMRQVADRIELMAAGRPQQGVTIHLQPHGLGDVTIVVKGVGKDIEATFSATNASVRNALSDGRDALTAAITAKGYNLVGVNVAAHAQSMSGRDRHSSPNQEQPSQPFGNPSSGGPPSGGSNFRGGPLPSSATISTGPEADTEIPALADDGVDYRI